MNGNISFDIGKWFGRVIFEPANYFELGNFVADKNRLRDYALSKNWVRGVQNDDSEVTLEEKKLEGINRQFYVDDLTDSIMTSLDTLSSQMVVVAVSLIEAMIQEYCVCVFAQHPQRMHEYLEAGGKKGMVQLGILTESSSRDEAILLLSRKCADRVLEGKFEACLKRVSNISKREIDPNLIQLLLKLALARNRIVHESSGPVIKSTDVQTAFDTMRDLLEWLGNSALVNDVPIHDPGCLVLDEYFEEAEQDK